MTGCKMKNTSYTSFTPLDSRISVLEAFELVAGFSHMGCVRQSLQPYGWYGFALALIPTLY